MNGMSAMTAHTGRSTRPHRVWTLVPSHGFRGMAGTTFHGRWLLCMRNILDSRVTINAGEPCVDGVFKQVPGDRGF
jgi:hypothetical protein